MTKALFLALLFSLPAFGQGSSVSGNPVVINSSGQPIPGAIVAVCTTNPGTTTPPCATLATTYTDITLSTPCSGVQGQQPLNNANMPSVGTGCSNPGLTDQLGNVVVYAPGGSSYFCQYYGPNMATTVLPCIFPATVSGILSSANTWSGTNNFTAGGSLSGFTIGATGPSTLTGGGTLSGGFAITANSLNQTQFCDQFSGADASAKIAACIAALPTAGGIADARNLSDVGGSGSTTIDPGSRSVTLLLGPYTYNFSQVVLRSNFHIIGNGTGTGLSGTKQPTAIKATNGAIPLMVLGQTASEGQEDVVLRGLNLQGASGNSNEPGIQLIGAANSGLWYSEFDDVVISGFAGIGLDLESTNTTAPGAINQFDTFKRVIVFRTNGGSYALQIRGFNNSLKFENCQFDGSVTTQGGDGLTNINILGDVAGGSFPPYDIKFDLLTSQWAGVAMAITGADAVSVDQGHFEGDYGVFLVNSSATFGTLNLSIHDSGFFNGTGQHGGNGYIINNAASTNNASIAIIDSHAYSIPDAFMKGNTGSIVSYGNVSGVEGSYTIVPFQSGSPNGFGNGTPATAVTTTTKGTGTGPATPQTIVGYIQTTQSGTTYWIPVMQ